MNWKRQAARRWPGYSVIGDGKYAALDKYMGVVRLYSTRLQLITCAPTGSAQIELAEESAARPRDIRCFETDPA